MALRGPRLSDGHAISKGAWEALVVEHFVGCGGSTERSGNI